MTPTYNRWRKSSHSNPDGECVEAGRAADGTVGVRDSKHHGAGPVLGFTRPEWAAFLTRIRSED